MQTYIGTKIIRALPMTRQEYNDYRGWQLPADENGDDEGYLVEYVDGGKANDSRHAGYISWSPKEVFERAYRPVENMSFGLAIDALKSGKRVARAGWNGKGMWLSLSGPLGGRLIPSDAFWSKNNAEYAAQQEQFNGHAMVLPCITMKTATGEILMGWLASQTDMLADDWCIAECQGAKCSAIDGQDHSHECIVEAAETQGWSDAPEAIEAKLTVAVTAFIEEHGISCPETIYQTDRVIENAAQLIEKLADVVGYIQHKEPK